MNDLENPLSISKQNHGNRKNSTHSTTEANKKALRKPFTSEEIIATENLKQLWSEYRLRHVAEHGEAITQAKAASQMGWTQSNFSQYLNGIVPIGSKAAHKISIFLGCKVSEIHQDYRDSEAVAEKEKLKSMLGDIMTILSQLSRGETDAMTAHRTAQSIVDNSGYAEATQQAL